MADDARPITDLLRRLGQGDRGALDQLVELLYTTLWRMCRSRLGRLPPGSLTATALLNELYIDLAGRFPDLANRRQFFAYAHEAIAGLSHPSIVTFHDSGVTEEALPYFVFEYIEGEPITA